MMTNQSGALKTKQVAIRPEYKARCQPCRMGASDEISVSGPHASALESGASLSIRSGTGISVSTGQGILENALSPAIIIFGL
jgi:hypothetical protein